MRAYVVARGAPLAPFGEPAAALPIGNVVWGEAQGELLRRAGLEVVRVASVDEIPAGEDRVVTFDDVFFTRRVLKSLLQRWRKAGRPPAQVGLPEDSTFVETFSDLQDSLRSEGLALYDLFALPAGQVGPRGSQGSRSGRHAQVLQPREGAHLEPRRHRRAAQLIGRRGRPADSHTPHELAEGRVVGREVLEAEGQVLGVVERAAPDCFEAGALCL